MTKDRLEWIIRWLDYPLLSEWEERFVESIEEQFKINGRISDKQEEIIERIYKEKSL